MQKPPVEILKESLENASKNPADSLWNSWHRKGNYGSIEINGVNIAKLGTSSLIEYDFSEVKFFNCIFDDIDCYKSSFYKSAFSEDCKILGGRYVKTDFEKATFKHVTFSDKCSLRNSNLSYSIFEDCKLLNVAFRGASLLGSTFIKCQIEGCSMFGANLWGINIDNDTRQTENRIEPYSEQRKKGSTRLITTDDIALSQIIYLLTNNNNLSQAIDDTKSRSVLILGRFGDNLEGRLNRIKEKLRSTQFPSADSDTKLQPFNPIVFDFKKGSSLDLIEEIVLLAMLSSFIIADLSNPKSIPAELQAILTILMIPVIPIIDRESEKVYSTFDFANKFAWVHSVIVFDDIEEVIEKFEEAIISPAHKLYQQIGAIKKDSEITKINIKDV